MWNPFKKKSENFLKTIQHHILHKKKPHYTMRNATILIILVILIWTIIIIFRDQVSTPLIQNTPVRALLDTWREASKKEWEKICVQHPDIFIFHYNHTGSSDVISTGALYNQIGGVRDLAEKGAIVLIEPANFSESLKQSCFPWNPIWILSESGSAYLTLHLIAGEYQIPLFSRTFLDMRSLSGYALHEFNIDQETNGGFFHKILQKYLELESGGIFKDIY